MKRHNKKEKMMKPKAVIVDIDGTLFEEVPGWTQETDLEWVEKTLDMPELEVGIALLKVLKDSGFELIFLTARGQTCVKNTWKRFRKAGIAHLVDKMHHRPVNRNGQSSVVYKEWKLKQIMKNYNVVYAMDDHEGILEMYRSYGIKVFDAKKWW